jgi:predicted CxxxxCH...CXXCH cytochrome family protein
MLGSRNKNCYFEAYIPLRGYPLVFLTLVVFLLCLLPECGCGIEVHNFDCKICHKLGISYTDLGNATSNVCLQCHKENPPSVLMLDGRLATPAALFSPVDASNAMGSYPDGMSEGEGSGTQSSHMWSGRDVNSAAGAQPPLNRYFYGRYGISTGKLTCQRCHDPHSRDPENTKILRLGSGSKEQMCLDCHRSWNLDSSHRGRLSHPLVADYAAVASAQPEKYRTPAEVAAAAGEIELVDGAVSCSSCHGVHFADSDAATVDGPGRELSAGDGCILRSSGPQAADTSVLCTACHSYGAHGNPADGGETVGCLACHSGHSYTNSGDPNYFVLRKEVTTATFGTIAGLDYSDPAVLDEGQKYTFWNDQIDGSATGYCEKCHGDAKDIVPGAGNFHVRTAVCTNCHVHSRDNSFAASCDGCHAYPPAWGSHPAHLESGGIMAAPQCWVCHKSAEHMNDLSEVRFDAGDGRVSTAAYSGDDASNYTLAGDYAASSSYGSCASLYCHSNGAPFDKTITYKNPAWGGAPLNCTSCHAGGGAATSLSGRHRRHTDASTYGFDCARCHAGTASSSTVINDNSKHVNQSKDVDMGGGSYDSATRACDNSYCHSDGRGGAPQTAVQWSDTASLGCTGCHKGRIGDGPEAVQMASNGHHRLANEFWIRQYPCEYCHYNTVDGAGAIKDYGKHLNETKDVAFTPQWNIAGYPVASYDPVTKTCDNLYCHSDGTTVNPEVRDFPWDSGQAAGCDACHGHRGDCSSCHEGMTGWPEGQEWLNATPMYPNTGPGTDRANSHVRHLETDFSCGNCHYATVVGSCEDCHGGGIPQGVMSESGHVDADYHVNKVKDVVFKDGGTYDPVTKTCSNTACHNGDAPVWGDSADNAVLCLTCHGTTGADVDDYGGFNGTQARINMSEWGTTGHGRPVAAGNYSSGNRPADFPGNPCWYCHDSEVLHKDINNPYRLKVHPQFIQRFEKECVYCHMERTDAECRSCHDTSGGLSSQLIDITGPDYSIDHAPFAGDAISCLTSGCHLPQSGGCLGCHDNPGDTTNATQMNESAVQVGMASAPYAVSHQEFAAGGAYESISCMATPAEWPPTGCHGDDVHIHNVGTGVWTASQKEDVKNQYIMMGVCLQCHDSESDGVKDQNCTSCHTWSGAPEDNPYTIGYDPGTGEKYGESKGSSSHFGYKHFETYEDSLAAPEETGTFSVDGSLHPRFDATVLVDETKSWSADQFIGHAVKITSGALSGETRPVLVNDATTITVSGVFSGSVIAGTSYALVNTEWRGGKFCWDCHDPHGDSNIYMIQDEVTVRSDGLFGKPMQQRATTFTRTQSGMDYAKSSPPYDGICNVCHTDVEHYHFDYGDAHRSGRACTDCHNHGFAEGHGTGEDCSSCHQQKPVPNHLGFGQPRDCVTCHDGVINKRMDIMGQFRANSHHVQGIPVTNLHCYACHWEATPEGLIANDYHEGYNYETHGAILNAKVDLVIWEPGSRPTAYQDGVTGVNFTAEKISTADERTEVAGVSQHCLSCHSDQNNDTDVFGDCKTPRQYAWDRTSIAARYSQTETTTLGKYTGLANAAKKNLTKAFSAHGNAVANEGGWSAATGEDAAITNTRAGTQNVQCFDCHSSHGSFTEGITSSYRTFNNTYNGGNLKETQAGKGGYGVTYRARETTEGVNPMNAGAAQCFDCHETRDAGVLPWGYHSTYGATEPIQGYWDSARFGGGMNGTKTRFGYRAGITGKGGHLKASTPLVNAGQVDGSIHGLCSPCHDPHGVSPSLGENQAYAVPLLKGTWLSSPYKEDYPNVTSAERTSSFIHLDRNTFGAEAMAEDATQFGGLCLRCHPKESLTDGIDKNTGFKSLDRIHETVKGWGNNAEHNYSCSKCHQPHSSGLGRLMRTNCLDFKHRGEVASGGSAGDQYPYFKDYSWQPCHESMTGNRLNQQWNDITPW